MLSLVEITVAGGMARAMNAVAVVGRSVGISCGRPGVQCVCGPVVLTSQRRYHSVCGRRSLAVKDHCVAWRRASVLSDV